MAKHLVGETTTSTVDKQTGEILVEKKEIVKRLESTPNFVMIFTDSIGEFAGLTKAESGFLFALLAEAKKDNEVVLNKHIKERIAIKADLKPNSASVIVSNLTKKAMLIKSDYRGIYYLNPEIFGKGSWRDIKRLRMMLEVDVEAGKINKAYEVETYTQEIGV